jgi:uncharacterized protein YndB with AHSA1/START domain
MENNLLAKASVTINAPRAPVWQALIDPEAIKQYMFDTNVSSDWREGSPIVWRGVWQGKPYTDKGVILQFKSGERIQYSHFSPLSGVPDKPENYHIVTIDLMDTGNQTRVTLTQNNSATEEERAHSEENWKMVLAELKKFVEQT